MKKTIIIAEAGVNHNGSLEIAKELILVASKAGADYVKFQTFKADRLVTKESKMASYQLANMPNSENSQYSMLKSLELPELWHYELKQFAHENGIKFLSTGFDIESIDFLDKLDFDFYKIPSGEITNKPYLEHVASKGKSIVLSTGMANIDEIRNALRVLELSGLEKSRCSVLHCNTEYPTPYQDVNLKAMLHIKNELGVAVGYSDHTLGIEVPIAAVTLGAEIIEKHFTIDRKLTGPDHKASLEPNELASMIQSIRNTEYAISGSGLKSPSISESKNLLIGRKSIYYKCDLNQGHLVTANDLEMKRPGNGISPMEIDLVLGKTLNRNVSADTLTLISDFY
jgi:N,N'-diacetyllegionaminate synthase